MGADSKIEWTHHTFNPWRGCTKVSAGCANCYAEALSVRNPRVLGIWGDAGTRVVAAESYWKQPLAWNRTAAAAGERHRVFCASLADVFEDRPELVEPRVRLFELINDTPNLDWLLLTKRPQNIEWMYDEIQRVMGWETDPDVKMNIWLGVSAENQPTLEERVGYFSSVRWAKVRFLSLEPLLGPINLHRRALWADSITKMGVPAPPNFVGVDWVIVGGESGPKARRCNVEWTRSIVTQCEDAGVACLVKQLGANVIDRNDAGFDADSHTWADGPDAGKPVNPTAWPEGPYGICIEHDIDGFREQYQGAPVRIRLHHSKGGDPAEWPLDLRVRQFPQV